MRILHILAPGVVGGLERVVQALARGHSARGAEVHVAAVLDAAERGHPFPEAFRGTAVDVHPLPLPARAYRRERARVRQLVGSLGPDVVHTHGYRADVVDAAAARLVGVPVVTTVHGFTGGGLKNRVYEWMQRRAFRGFAAVVAVSRPLRERLVATGLAPERVHLIPNAWGGVAPALDRHEARAALGVPEGRFHVGWVGRLSTEKGPDVLIDALPRLADLPLHVSMVGSGPMHAALVSRAARLGVAHRVQWHDEVLDAARLFAGFDAFVLSSRTEGTPIVLFEAMAAAAPVVATRVGGVPDVVSAAEALLVPPGSPAALADAVRRVYTHPEGARARARAASQRLDAAFGLEPWLDRYEAVYRGVRHTDP